jgi:hypothetical protein
METIRLLLANSDRKVNNQVEVAVLDVCYDRAAVQSTRASRLEELVHQGSLWDFDLIVIGADNLFRDRTQKTSASADEVTKAIEAIRAHCSAPIIVLTVSKNPGPTFLQAGADSVLAIPLSFDQLKSKLRALLDLNGLVDEAEPSRWSGIGSFLRGFQKAKV